MNKRLAMLEQLLQTGKADSFALYALGMEYRKESRIDDAVRTFQTLKDKDPGYVPLYLMAGQMLLDENRAAEARPWLEAGLTAADRKGDSKARSEIASALANCE